jgi:hypothetical protein
MSHIQTFALQKYNIIWISEIFICITDNPLQIKTLSTKSIYFLLYLAYPNDVEDGKIDFKPAKSSYGGEE